jgi:hypothetical protein
VVSGLNIDDVPSSSAAAAAASVSRHVVTLVTVGRLYTDATPTATSPASLLPTLLIFVLEPMF